MASTFACQPWPHTQVKTCMFEGISPCRDQVSHLICNAHAAIFGLVYKMVNLHDGDNNPSTLIQTYISSANNLNIPLFLDGNNKILLDSIRIFSLNVCQNFPNIKVDALSAKIACLMGVNMNPLQDHCRKTWFDVTGSALTIRNNSGDMQYFKALPPLHKALFYFVNASNTRNVKTGAEVYLISNVCLTRNETNDSYSFIVPNKELVFKYTDKPNCVATPIILEGIRVIEQETDELTFRPVQPRYDTLC